MLEKKCRTNGTTSYFLFSFILKKLGSSCIRGRLIFFLLDHKISAVEKKITSSQKEDYLPIF